MTNKFLSIISTNKSQNSHGKFLFGKYRISKVSEYPDSLTLHLEDFNSTFAIADINLNEKPCFGANFARNNPNANPELFKQLYEDAKIHFSTLGLQLNKTQTQEILGGLELSLEEGNLENSKELERTLFPARFLTSTTLMGHEIENTLDIMELIKQTSELLDTYLLERYPDQKQEILPYSSLGVCGQTKGWILEQGYNIFLETPTTKAYSPFPINIQINSDETNSDEEVLELRENIKEVIVKKFNIDFIPNSNISHKFHIDLSDLNGRKIEDIKRQINIIS